MRPITAFEKWSYAVGNIPYAVKDTAFGTFVVFYYTQVLGLSGTMAGLAMLIALSWDAISDPIVGSWSDAVRSRWGRRHPLMLAGGVPTALCLLLLFSPPDSLDEFQVFLWLVVVSILLRTFLTIYHIPYTAMGAEMSDDYDERTVIAKARITIAWLGGMALPAVAYTLIFQAQGDIDGRLIAENYFHYGVLSALVAAVTALYCVWGTRSIIAHLPQAIDQPLTLSLKKPLTDLLLAMRNINFRQTIGTKLAFGIAAGIYTVMGLYLGTYFWEFSTEQLAGLLIPTLFGTLTAFFVLNRLGRRYDKPQLISVICLAFAVNTIWFLAGRLFGLLPENGHPILYPLIIIQTYISVLLIVSLQVLGVSLLADILDEHQLQTGIRQEGVFFAASAFVYKATTGFGNFAAGIAVDAAGLQPGAAPGSVAEPVLLSLGWFMVLSAGICCFIAWHCARRVKLGRSKVEEIRLQLTAVDGQALPGPR